MPIDAIYVIHHTHTDVGFTNDQPIFRELQYRFIDDALRLIDRHAGNPPESRVRWTVETTCGLDAWLKTASSRDIDRLVAADKAGLLEVMRATPGGGGLLTLFNAGDVPQSATISSGLVSIEPAHHCDLFGR